MYSINLDKCLKIIEDKAGKMISKILSDQSILHFKHKQQKVDFAFFLASQKSRTAFFKNKVLDGLLLQGGYSGSTKDDLFHTYNNPILLQFEADVFIQKKWFLLVNNTPMPFWTSDNPVGWVPENTMPIYGGFMYFPILPNLMLCMYDDVQLKGINKKEFSAITVNLERVKHLNNLTLHTANTFLFSNKVFPKIRKVTDSSWEF